MKKTKRLALRRVSIANVGGGRFGQSWHGASCYAQSYDAGCSESCNTCQEWCVTNAYTICDQFVCNQQ
jgi:hypothetical protein